MATPRHNRRELWIRAAAFAAGLLVTTVALVGWRVAPGERTPGTDLTFLSVSSGELQMSPAGVFLAARDLKPAGRPVEGSFRVRNLTGRVLALRMRAGGDSRELDRLLAVRVTSGGRTLYRGLLGRLRTGGARPLVFAPGEERRVTIRTRIPAARERGWEGRLDTVTVVFEPAARSAA